MTELLAPVGGFDSLKAAVYSGADAVYLGLDRFSARASAKNFKSGELKDAVSFCHEFCVSCFLAFNTIIKENELEQAAQVIKIAAEAGVDGIIVQDLGVFNLIKKLAQTMDVHASTQMSIHTKGGAKLLKKLGCKRVVLAREMSVKEIKEVCDLGIETEVFVHGALCFCVSGQCYMSQMIGGRSANRGNCAQPCRLPFSASDPGRCDLSLKDLCSIDSIEELKKAGVYSFKIEGRMKRPEYVASATSAYRKALDGEKAEISELRKVFSRNGFTNGYLEGKIDSDMFGVRSKKDAVPDGLYAKIREDYRRPLQRIGIFAKIKIKNNEPIELSFSIKEKNITVTIEGENPQPAQNRELDKDSVLKAIKKLGGTPFYLQSEKIELDEALYVSLSELGNLKREAVRILADQFFDKKIEAQETNLDFLKINPFPAKNLETISKLRLECDHFDQICFKDEFEFICLDMYEIIKHEKELEDIMHKLVVMPPSIMFSKEEQIEKDLQKIESLGVKHALVKNIGHIPILKGFVLHGGFSLNISNSQSVEVLKELGFRDFIISPECNLIDIKQTASKEILPLGAMASGKLPLMVSRSCPIKRVKTCKECGGESFLTDRKNKKLKVNCKNGYIQITNPDLLWMSDRLSEIKGASFGIIKLTSENENEAEKTVHSFIQKLKYATDITRGCYYK